MFTWLKQLLHPKKEAQIPLKPIIITIHGYGRRRKHEMDNLAAWGKEDDFEIVQFDMYDLFDEMDCSWKTWVARAEEVLKTYERQNRPIFLVGFSMGGVIASYLASVYKVEKLVLLAPAFNYINMDNITGMISKSATSLWTTSDKKDEIELPKSFYIAFTDVVKHLKKAILKVECPVLMLHGDQDEVISLRSSLSAYDKITHQNKKLLILHEGHHRLLMDEKVNWECYQWMKLFFTDVILSNRVIEQAPDVMEKLLQQKAQLQKEKEIINQQD